jgi:protein-tyrosine phosphatase
VRICFVCSGNICRSPTAEVVLQAHLSRAGIAHVEVDSAGTGDWHAGQDMDKRARATLAAAGYEPAEHAAKQFTAADFATRDLVLALDESHLKHLTELAAEADDPESALSSLALFRSYDPTAVASGDLDVPDPYYGGQDGFAEVLAQVERASAGLLGQLRP